MEKRMGVSEARKTFARMIDDVKHKGEHYIIVQRGEPAAALVPMHIYLEWKRERNQLFERIRTIQARNAEADPDEVMVAVLAAQQLIRQS